MRCKGITFFRTNKTFTKLFYKKQAKLCFHLIIIKNNCIESTNASLFLTLRLHPYIFDLSDSRQTLIKQFLTMSDRLNVF